MAHNKEGGVVLRLLKKINMRPTCTRTLTRVHAGPSTIYRVCTGGCPRTTTQSLRGSMAGLKPSRVNGLEMVRRIVFPLTFYFMRQHLAQRAEGLDLASRMGHGNMGS